jgi:hypothetical protein
MNQYENKPQNNNMNEDNAQLTTQDSAISETDSKGGRPTKYEPETVDRLLAALADGLTQKQACAASGISESTLSGWRKCHPELEPRLAQAREAARQKGLKALQSAGDKDWRAWEAWLKYAYAADYRRDTSVNVNASATVQQGVVISEEKRRELQEKLRRLQDQTGALPDKA